MKLTKNQWVAVGAALTVIILFVIYTYFFNFSNQFAITMDQQQAGEENNASSTENIGTPAEGQLGIKDVVVGSGEEAKAGDSVTVNYTGTFTDGKKFDSSYDHGQPFTFILGQGQVIAGWDEGVLGMRIGGKRQLTVPSNLGYGPDDYASIPGNSTLLFEVELLNVTHPAQTTQ